MTTDSTQPQTDLGPAPANGQVQSQGHRRRRRRRKNKNAQPGAQPVTAQGQQAPSPAHTPPIPAMQAAPPPKAHHAAHQGQGRKKKKFFQKGSPNPAQSGNSVSSHAHSHSPGNSQGGSQGKRKGKQKGPREFVGPMDHSYRAVNGNVADGPPSTIQITSNGHGGGYFADNFAPPAAVAVRHDAPTRIFCFIDDLFFQAKIIETSKKLGIKVEFVKGDKESVAKMTDVAEADRPALVVFDLNNPTAKPLTLIPKIKTKLKKSTSIVGFLNHLQGDLKAKAVEAGCDTVMPRSAFSQSLPNLLRRYGVEEEEDNYPQPV
jgi:CheY-like chemotaxis protein